MKQFLVSSASLGKRNLLEVLLAFAQLRSAASMSACVCRFVCQPGQLKWLRKEKETFDHFSAHQSAK